MHLPRPEPEELCVQQDNGAPESVPGPAAIATSNLPFLEPTGNPVGGSLGKKGYWNKLARRSRLLRLDFPVGFRAASGSSGGSCETFLFCVGYLFRWAFAGCLLSTSHWRQGQGEGPAESRSRGFQSFRRYQCDRSRTVTVLLAHEWNQR